MKTRFSKLMAIVMVFALIVAFAAIPASAESSNGDVTGGTVTIDKFLVLEGTNIAPVVEFRFTIANGTAVTETGKLPILAGRLAENVTKTVTFNSTSTVTENYTSTDSNLNGKNVAVGTISINEITNAALYTSPGIYRYTVTESAVAAPYSIVGNSTKYIDVYVEYPQADPTTLTVTKAILYDSVASYDDTNGSTTATKTAAFINRYETKELDFSKTVQGNQGDKTKFFTFTVQAASGSQFHISDKFIVKLNNGAAYHSDNNYSSQTVGNDLYVTGQQLNDGFKVQLKDASDVKIIGLPSTLSVTVSENAEDYTPSFSNVTGDVTTDTGTATATMSTDANIPFVNNKGGAIPTGVLLTIAPFAIGLLLFGALAIFFIARKKKREE